MDYQLVVFTIELPHTGMMQAEDMAVRSLGQLVAFLREEFPHTGRVTVKVVPRSRHLRLRSACCSFLAPLGSASADNVNSPLVTLHDATDNMMTLRPQRRRRFHDQPGGPATHYVPLAVPSIVATTTTTGPLRAPPRATAKIIAPWQ